MSFKKHITPLKKIAGWLFIMELPILVLFGFILCVRPDFLEFIQWENETYWWLIILSPFISLAFLWNYRWKQNSLTQWHRMSLDAYEASETDASFGVVNFSSGILKFILLKLAMVSFILAIMSPKSGGEMKETTSEGVELMVALDLSKSMLAEDVMPNRLYVAKTAIKNTINTLGGDVVGLVVFGGNAYTQMPLTTDYGAALSYLESTNTSTVPTQGTSLSAAITESLSGFDYESSASKLVLLFTDGEDHEEELEAAISEAKEKGVKVCCVAMGSVNGAPIPDYASEDRYKKDQNGNTIITKANRALLKSISSETGGDFFELSSSRPAEIKPLTRFIKQQQTSETGSFVLVDLTPRFQIPLFFGVLFLMGAFVIKEKKEPWF
ncbi:MAG: VWA domain-containing protein [Flavobacteriales bacterium]